MRCRIAGLSGIMRKISRKTVDCTANRGIKVEESNLSEQRKFMKKSDLLVILVLAGVFLGGWF